MANRGRRCRIPRKSNASAVAELIALRIALVRRQIEAERQAFGPEIGHEASDLASFAPPTTDERKMGFVAWVRSREPQFFETAASLNGASICPARAKYGRRMLAYAQAWRGRVPDRHQPTWRQGSFDI
jgi:hypothetical protein